MGSTTPGCGFLVFGPPPVLWLPPRVRPAVVVDVPLAGIQDMFDIPDAHGPKKSEGHHLRLRKGRLHVRRRSDQHASARDYVVNHQQPS